jgi:hypothetical protein
LREQNLPYPSIRTIQHRLHNLKFEEGILQDIFNLMKLKIASFQPQEKHACLLIDEMAIKPGLVYESSTSKTLGQPTINGSAGKCDDLATHGLVFMLAGVTSKWKQTVTYEFTGNSISSQDLLQKIMAIITKAHEIGLSIRVVISDMGPQNRGFWRLLNVVAGKHSEIKNYTLHPYIPEEKLFIMPDPVHIFKNVAGALTNGHKFFLAEELREEFQLPSTEISLDPIKRVMQLDKDDVIKLCPRLKENVINPNHFEKMNMYCFKCCFIKP